MFRSIRLKFLGIYLLVVVIIFLVFNLGGTRLLRSQLVESRKELMYKEAELIEGSYLENYFQEQMSSL